MWYVYFRVPACHFLSPFLLQLPFRNESIIEPPPYRLKCPHFIDTKVPEHSLPRLAEPLGQTGFAPIVFCLFFITTNKLETIILIHSYIDMIWDTVVPKANSKAGGEYSVMIDPQCMKPLEVLDLKL